MSDDTGAAARAMELAEPMADILASPLAAVASEHGREPLDGTDDLDFFLGVTTAFAAVFTVALGGGEGDSLHRTLIHTILGRVSGSDEAADRFTGFVTEYMESGERPQAFLDGFAVGERAGNQCCHEDAPEAARQTLYGGYSAALAASGDSE